MLCQFWVYYPKPTVLVKENVILHYSLRRSFPQILIYKRLHLLKRHSLGVFGDKEIFLVPRGKGLKDVF